jgi:dipeptidyl aminopeptidase/acylaminoacyl peptidase
MISVMPHAFSLVIRRILAIAVFLSAGAALAQQAPPAGLPPLIDRQLFFGNPEISSATLSPDGRYIAFRKPYKDTLNIWVKKADEPFDRAKLLTNDTRRPIPALFWSRDSKYVLFVQDQAGDENYNVYAVDPAEQPRAGSEVPAARNLTEAKGARALIYDVPLHDPDVIFVGLNDRDAAWHDVYEVRISTGARKLLRRNTDRIAGWMFDRAGRLRVAVRTTDAGDTEILRVTDTGFEPVYSCTVFESCGPERFHKDNQRVYLVTNRGEPDLMRLVLLDPQTGKEELVESDPDSQVDFGGALFSDKTGDLLATYYIGDRRRTYFRDKALGADYDWITKQLPGVEISLAGSTADERRWMLVASSDREPGVRYLFDRDKKTLAKQYQVFEKLPREHLADMQAIRYPSSDGLEIPAYLTLPKGAAPRNLPTLVVPHGGPWARDEFGYDAMAQFFANRGYAVLQPNFRGSTGYGEKFLNAGNKEWGQKMQDDLTWGVKHLVTQGIADPKRVGIIGGSYGGYATLAGVAFTPDVYAAAVSIVGPSNLITLLQSIPPYWEAGRKIFHARMGDPTTPDGKAQLERQSPLKSADKIRTPLLVVQGANDPRVKKAESDQIVVALRDRGFPVEYLVAPDEGHGFARPVNNMAMYASAEKFLAKHLGARAQEDMPTDVATRLKEITVDPKSVTLAKKIDTAAIALPVPAHPLATGTTAYSASLNAGGQSTSIDVSRTVADDGAAWVVTESAKMPAGEVTDKTVIDKKTFVLQRREIRQGPVAIDLAFADGKATGKLSMGGQEKPLMVDLGGELFADGSAAYVSLAALPLANGYTATFRNFDVQRARVTVKRARVTGVEQVTVPGGTFTAWKVEIASAEGDPGEQTVWIDQASRKVVKTFATLPQMPGATATAELAK